MGLDGDAAPAEISARGNGSGTVVVVAVVVASVAQEEESMAGKVNSALMSSFSWPRFDVTNRADGAKGAAATTAGLLVTASSAMGSDKAAAWEMETRSYPKRRDVMS